MTEKTKAKTTESLFVADHSLADNSAEPESAEPEWCTAVPGFRLTPAEIRVSGSHQASKLNACGIAPAIFGTALDPSFLIGIGIQAGIRSGISAQGNINMMQKLVLYRPALIDEVLLVRGEIEAVVAVPRGDQVQTKITFEDAQGRLVADASRTSLRPASSPAVSRAPVPDKSATRGAGERPQPVVAEADRTQTVSAHTLSPAQVKTYSMEGNSIHYEEEAARAAGFRAPMIGGGMGVHFLAAALWSRCSPVTIDLSIYFRRPIFWDEHFSSAVLTDGVPDGVADGVADGVVNIEDVTRWRALCLLRDEGEKGLKVLTEAKINELNL